MATSSILKLTIAGVAFFTLMISYAHAEDESPEATQARELVQRSQVEEAIKLLQKRVEAVPDDVPSRLLLGQILDFDGRPEEAVAVWQAGSTDEKPVAGLLIAIGHVRNQQGKDGPSISRRRGVFSAKPGSDKAKEQQFKKEHFALALKAYQAALDTGLDNPRLAMQIARLHLNLDQAEESEEILRKFLAKHPDDPTLLLQLAYTLQFAGKQPEAIAAFEKALTLQPRDARAHQSLVELYAMSDPEKAKLHERQARFYQWLPEFLQLEYSDANYARFERLVADTDQAEALLGFSGKKPQPDRDIAIEELFAEESPTSLSFLAALCWRHDDHGTIENRSFDVLEKSPQYGVPLLKDLLRNAQTTCTARGAALALARIKDKEAFDLIVPLLPGDTRWMFDMNIAGALVELGDVRAVKPLVQFADVSFEQPIPKDDPMEQGLGHLMARQRAVLALGAFDTEESRAALEQGLKNPQLALASHTSLYLLTKAKEHLDAVAAALDKNDDNSSYLVALALKQRGDEAGKALAEKWNAARAAEQAARERKCEEERKAEEQADDESPEEPAEDQ